jgi:hypothetical protein
MPNLADPCACPVKPTRRQHSWPARPALLAMAWWLLAASAPAHAEPPMVRLIDQELNASTVQLMGIERGTLSYIDATGLIRTEPWREFVAILPAEPEEAPESVGVVQAPLTSIGEASIALLETIDGERWPGEIESQTDQIVRWSHPHLGELEIPLDRVSRLGFVGRAQHDLRSSEAAAPDEAASQDRVWLANGDRLEGYVETVHPRVRVEVRGVMRELEPRSVASIQLANARVSPAGTLVRLRDGSILRVRELSMDDQGVLTVLAQSAASSTETPADEREAGIPSAGVDGLRDSLASDGLNWTHIESVLIDASRVVPLGSMQPRSVEALGGRAWVSAIVVEHEVPGLPGTPEVILPGPMEVRWVLPAGSGAGSNVSRGVGRGARVALEASMPPGQWAWGDSEIVVLADERELSRARVNGRSPRVQLNAGLPPDASTLAIRIEPGRFGPVQDGLRLRGAIVLLGSSASRETERR